MNNQISTLLKQPYILNRINKLSSMQRDNLIKQINSFDINLFTELNTLGKPKGIIKPLKALVINEIEKNKPSMNHAEFKQSKM